MKAVLISIQPKWCELIASGKKTVEVRKTKPKLEMPFKVYIYETQGRTETPFVDEEGHEIFKGRGQVIGEFVCDSFYAIMNFLPYEGDDNHHTVLPCVLEQTCLTEDEIDEYLGQKDGYGWHITDLVIYDEPKELSEFYQEGKNGDKFYYDYCAGCSHHETPVGEDPCNGCDGNRKYLYRPPQSWCYCEELKGETE
jgi:predicted transcriptional regulator